jgi:hypothetical protein
VRLTDHPLPSISTEVKNAWSHISTLPYVCVVCLLVSYYFITFQLVSCISKLQLHSYSLISCYPYLVPFRKIRISKRMTGHPDLRTTHTRQNSDYFLSISMLFGTLLRFIGMRSQTVQSCTGWLALLRTCGIFIRSQRLAQVQI